MTAKYIISVFDKRDDIPLIIASFDFFKPMEEMCNSLDSNDSIYYDVEVKIV